MASTLIRRTVRIKLLNLFLQLLELLMGRGIRHVLP